MKKYYWLVYSYNNAGGGKTNVMDATTDHPFKYIDNKINSYDMGRSKIIENIALLNWKEITKKEYELFYNI